MIKTPPEQLDFRFRQALASSRSDLILTEPVRQILQALDASLWPGGIIVLCGPEGSGKTHLATVWAQQYGALVIHTAADLASALATNAQVLLLENAAGFADDLNLFHLVNRALAGECRILMTDRVAPSRWTTPIPDMISRLRALRILDLPEPGDDVLARLIRNEFEQRLIQPPDDVIPYLTGRLERSARIARIIVDRLDRAARNRQVDVTRALATQVLADFVQTRIGEDDDTSPG